MSFLRQATYGFDAYEARNPTLQMNRNSKLEWGRYGGCAKGMQLQDWVRANCFWLFGLIFGPLFGLFLWQFGIKYILVFLSKWIFIFFLLVLDNLLNWNVLGIRKILF